ncbi:unnamed protein product [Moneuplotes crassus]|uniref:Uncharacterized protein n=1 Tax=Euplotes crassus TaxID=5936 RepID=A0AAD1X7Z2_EUPCR|nr:unnamed protein product [Moneuplotes crassus]
MKPSQRNTIAHNFKSRAPQANQIHFERIRKFICKDNKATQRSSQRGGGTNRSFSLSKPYRKQVKSISPSPGHPQRKRKFARTYKIIISRNKFNTPDIRGASTTFRCVNNRNFLSEEAKKKKNSFRINSNTKRTPLSDLKNRIKSLSPDQRKALSSAASQFINSIKSSKRRGIYKQNARRKFKAVSPTLPRRGIKKELQENSSTIFSFNNGKIPDNTIEPREYTSDPNFQTASKFDELHYKLINLKSSIGMVNSPYILSKKLQRLKSNKQDPQTQAQCSNLLNKDYISEVCFEEDL